MKLFVTKGATDQTIYVLIMDSSSTTGGRLTGLAHDSGGLTCYYVRPGGSATAITLAAQTVTGAHTDGGFVEVSSSNMPGWYRLDLPDAVAASGVNSVGLTLKGAANMVQCDAEIQLTSINLQDAVRMGLTALPNANAEAAGGLFTRGTGPGQINQPANGQIDANMAAISEDATAANNAESFFDGAGYAGTNNVIPTVTTLTNAPSDSSGVTTLLSRVTGAVALASDLATLAAKFSGITLIRHWLGAIMGKQTADSTALTEINASGAGSGTYNPVDDSLEALKDGSATLAEVTAATSHPVVLSWELQRAVPVSRFLALGSATGSILTNPTIASGDWKISKDGGAFANLATLPDVEPDGTNQVRLQLSESELDAEWIVILGIDQTATKEWRDVLITIKVTGATVKVVTDGSNAAGTFKISRFGLGTEATDMLKTAYLKPLTGALAGQVQKVTAYNSTTDFVTVSPDFTGIPADGVYMQVVNG